MKTLSPATAPPLAPAARWALASLSLTILLASLGTSIANVGLPTLASAFGASFQSVQWVVLAYLLAITTVVVSAGRLGDLMGRRRLLLGGVMLFTAACALCGAAPSLPALIAARAAQGVGAAVMMALAMAFVADTVPKARTGSAMGLLGTMSAVGTALGPTAGGALIAAFGWPAIFLACVPLGLLALFLAQRFLPLDCSSPNAAPPGFDHAGTVLLGLTLVAYALAMTLGRGRFGLLNVALLCASAGAGALFLFVQKTASSPLVRLAMFRNPALTAGCAMNALVTTVMMATLVVGPFYLSGALALSPAEVGLAMSCGPAVSALAGMPSGRLVDRFGSHGTTVTGLAGMALGACLLPYTAARWAVPGYVAPLALITAGYALFQAANNTAVMADVAADRRGVVSGLLNLSRNLGLVTGASVMGAVYSLGSNALDAAAAHPEAVAGGLRLTFTVAAALVLAALAIAAAARFRGHGAGGTAAREQAEQENQETRKERQRAR